MGMRITELHSKEVVCVSNGQRLGFVCDVEVTVPEGNVVSLIVPGPCRLLGLAGRRDDYVIPWGCIKRVGPDIVFIETKIEECRVPKMRKGL
jgi:YlmC/YmxH family sporulation protein